MGFTTDIIIIIQPRRGVMEASVIDSAIMDVKFWKKESCRVSRSIGFIARVFWAYCEVLKGERPFGMLA